MSNKLRCKIKEINQKVKEIIFAYPLIFVLFLAFLIRIIYLCLNNPLWWDSHVYIGMGKYIFSGGHLGIWEIFRPILHPLLLGLFWKIGLNPLIIGKLLDLIFSLFCVYLVYKISKEIFNREIALIGALLFGLTPLFIMFTGLILTEPLALLFGLLGIYFFVKKDQNKESYRLKINSDLFFCGLFLGLSFLTKFTQGIWFAGIFLVLLLKKIILTILERTKLKENIKLIAFMSLGFLLPIIPFLILNKYLYYDSLLPFTSGSWIVTTYSWLYNDQLSYYFTQFFFHNWLYLLFFGYLYYFFKEKHWKEEIKLTFVLIIFLTFAYFLYLPRKELRYLITALPFLSIFSSFMLYQIYIKLKSKPNLIIRPLAFVFLCILILLVSFNQLNFEKAPNFQKKALQIIQEQNVNGTILSSDPFLISITNLKVITFDGVEFANRNYQEQKAKYQLIFINDCDLICPLEDQACSEEKNQFLDLIGQENKIIFQEKIKNCTYTFFLKDY